MKAVVAAFNQEKALVGAFSVITNLRMELQPAPAPAHLSIECLRDAAESSLVLRAAVTALTRLGRRLVGVALVCTLGVMKLAL